MPSNSMGTNNKTLFYSLISPWYLKGRLETISHWCKPSIQQKTNLRIPNIQTALQISQWECKCGKNNFSAHKVTIILYICGSCWSKTSYSALTSPPSGFSAYLKNLRYPINNNSSKRNDKTGHYNCLIWHSDMLVDKNIMLMFNHLSFTIFAWNASIC